MSVDVEEAVSDSGRALRQAIRWTIGPIANFVRSVMRCFVSVVWVVIYWLVLLKVQPAVDGWLSSYVPNTDFTPVYVGLAGALIVMAGIVAAVASDRRRNDSNARREAARAIIKELSPHIGAARGQIVSGLGDPSDPKRVDELIESTVSAAYDVFHGKVRDADELTRLLRELRGSLRGYLPIALDAAQSALVQVDMRRMFGPTDLRFTLTTVIFGLFFTVLCTLFHTYTDKPTFLIGALLATAFSVQNSFLLIDEREI